MSLYHKRIYLRQKNSTLYNLINNHQLTSNINSNKSITNKYPQYQSLTKLSSINNINSSINFNGQLNYHCNNNSNNTKSTNNPITNKQLAKLLYYLHYIANNNVYIVFMSILTIYTIFAIDIDKGFFNVNASTYFSSIHSIAIFLFFIEILILSITKKQYFNRFYFWVDCFSTITMFLQLIWIQNLMSGASNVTVALSFAKVTKASRLSKIGARSSKIMKLIRLVKLIKLFKKEQKNEQQQQLKKQQQQLEKDDNDNDVVKEQQQKFGIYVQEQHQQAADDNRQLSYQQGNQNSSGNNQSDNSSNSDSESNQTGSDNISQQSDKQNEKNHKNKKIKHNSNYKSQQQSQQQHQQHQDGQQNQQSQSQQQISNVSSQNQYSSKSQSSSSNQSQSQSQTQTQHLQQYQQSHQVNNLNNNINTNQPRFTFNPSIIEKNTNHSNQQQHIDNGQEQLSINAEQQQQQQQSGKLHPNNINNNYYNNKQQQHQQLQYKFTIPSPPPNQYLNVNNNLNKQNNLTNNINSFGNNLSIPDIYQPSHQNISQEDKNNIEDIMKIFFTQNMNHFIQKGKQIQQQQHQLNSDVNQNLNLNKNLNTQKKSSKKTIQHKLFIKDHHNLQQKNKSQITQKQKQNKNNQQMKEKKKKGDKNKRKKYKNKNKKQNKTQFQQKKKRNKIRNLQQHKNNKIQLATQSKISLTAITNNKHNDRRANHNNKDTNNNNLNLNINNNLQLPSINQHYQNIHHNIHMQPSQNNKNRSSRSSSRLSFMKRKQIIQFTKNKQLKQKFNRSYNVNMTVNQIPFSNIVQKMQKQLQYLPPLNRHNVDPLKQQQIEQKYNLLIEKSKKLNEPKKVLSSQNLKVGQVLKQEIQKNIVIMVMGLIMILPIIAADTWFDSDPMLNSTAHLFIKDVWNIPTVEGRQELIESFIQTGLEMNTPLEYFYIPINETCCQFPRQFPLYSNYTTVMDYSQLRLSQQTIVIDSNMTIIFSKKISSQINSYLNLGRSLFITILLIFCSILFMRDIENHALNPLQKMSSLINKISTNPFQALKEINKQKNYVPRSTQSWSSHRLILVRNQNPDQEQLQTNILSNVIIKITSLLTIGAGEIGSQIISKNIENIAKQAINPQTNNNGTFTHINSQKSLGQNLVGVYVYLQLRGFDFMCDIFGEQIFRYVNKVTEIVHLCCIEMGGIPIEYDGKGFLLLFKPSHMLQEILLPERKSTRKMTTKQTVHSNVKHQYKNPLHKQYHANIKNSTKNNKKSPQPHPHQQQSSFSQSFSSKQQQSSQQQQSNILCNLSLLAISAMNRIILQINQLQQSRKLYQYIVQKYSSSGGSGNNNKNNNSNNNNAHMNINVNLNDNNNSINNNNNAANNNNYYYNVNNDNNTTINTQAEQVFQQNYQPHLVNSAIHIGECIYGSLGSPYKLQCKCIGFDIAYTRHLCHMLAQQSYGVSNILSQDIYTLLSQHQYLIKKLNIRQLDHVNIKQIRHKDYKQNPNINYMGLNKLLQIKVQKQIVTKLYTTDFYGKLEMYNSNQSQMINYGHTLSDFKLNRTFMLTDKHLSSHSNPSNKSFTNNKHHNTNNNLQHSRSKQSIPGNLRSLMSVDDTSQNCLLAYQQRQKWLAFAQHDDPLLLLMKLQSQYPVIKQSRANYQPQFFKGWNQALQSYYSQQLTDSLTQFKYLHTFNQPYYDGPSKVFINRIQNVNVQQLRQKSHKFKQNNRSQNNLNHSHMSLHHIKDQHLEPLFGVHHVVWKL